MVKLELDDYLPFGKYKGFRIAYLLSPLCRDYIHGNTMKYLYWYAQNVKKPYLSNQVLDAMEEINNKRLFIPDMDLDDYYEY